MEGDTRPFGAGDLRPHAGIVGLCHQGQPEVLHVEVGASLRVGDEDDDLR